MALADRDPVDALAEARRLLTGNPWPTISDQDVAAATAYALIAIAERMPVPAQQGEQVVRRAIVNGEVMVPLDYLVEMQRHRDAWKRYAKQDGEMPGDYLKGDDGPAPAQAAAGATASEATGSAAGGE